MKISLIKRRPIKSLWLVLFLLLMLYPFGWLFAENEGDEQTLKNRFASLGESIDQSILQEQEHLNGYEKELEQVKEREQIYKTELSTLKVQYSVYSNLVITSETQVKHLEQAFSGNLSAKAMVNTILTDFKQRNSRIKAQLSQTEGQIKLNFEQLNYLISDKKDQTAESRKLSEKLKRLLEILNRKKGVLARLSEIYEGYYEQYQDMEKQFTSLIDDFEREINKRKKQNILQRKTSLLFTKTVQEMVSDVAVLPSNLGTRFKKTPIFRTDGGLEFSSIVTIALMFVFLQYLLFKAYRSILLLDDKPYFKASTWAKMTVHVIRNSLFLAGNLGFLILCDYFFHIRLEYLIVDTAVQFMIVILLTRWAIDFLKNYPLTEKGGVPDELQGQIKRMAYIARYFSLIYIACFQLIGTEHILLVIFRMLTAIIFYVELYRFRKLLISCVDNSSLPVRMKSICNVIPLAGYGFLFSGLIMELSGYVQLALFLSVSLSETIIVIMWSTLFFQNLKEFKHQQKAQTDNLSEEVDAPKLSAHWLLTLLYAFIWVCFALIGIVYIWGDRQTVIHSIYKYFITPIQIGTMSFSVKNFFIAILFLVITHIVAKVWSNLFQKKLLTDSGMDIGLQDSITTISVYIIWTVGILMAMNVFGLNMTSITVVLGALGIGIGFGLQNIFNNFLSGIILLFERPIQVGDDVEINGIWATVKKINVRSTIVQTYDNATLIIPNSDFISSQVTNWSFKDKRIRRNIAVGVAYGSDVELVKSTLLETADQTPRVLKTPKPDVIFKDFGDNSLIFILRIWTRVEYFYSVESAVRTAIDRLFRERKIEISFPQRDLHIRSVDRDVIFSHEEKETTV